MKRSLLICLLLSCVTSCLWAQTDLTWIRTKEGKIVAVPKRAVFHLNLPKTIFKSYTPSDRHIIEAKLREFTPNLTAPIQFEQERPMDMMILSEAYRPFFNPYTPMLWAVSPMALDFNEISILPLNEQASFFASGQQYTWPGVGGLTRMNVGTTWQNDRVNFSVSGFGGRYYTPFNPSPMLMGGFRATAGYELTDWLGVRGWGQYVFYEGDEKRNPHMLLNPFYNHTSVGGAFEFKIQEDFRIGVGVNYEYNPFNGRMSPQLLLFPAGRIGSFQIGP